MNWETRTPEQRELMDEDVVVGRVRLSNAQNALWVAYIGNQNTFKKIGEGTLQEAQHLVAQEAAGRLRAHLLRDSAARFGLEVEQPGKSESTPERATGLRLIRGGAGEPQGE